MHVINQSKAKISQLILSSFIASNDDTPTTAPPPPPQSTESKKKLKKKDSNKKKEKSEVQRAQSFSSEKPLLSSIKTLKDNAAEIAA